MVNGLAGFVPLGTWSGRVVGWEGAHEAHWDHCNPNLLLLAVGLAFAPSAEATSVCTLVAAARVARAASGEAAVGPSVVSPGFGNEVKSEFKMQNSRFKSAVAATFTRRAATIPSAATLTVAGAQMPRAAAIAAMRSLATAKPGPRPAAAAKSKAESLGAIGMLRFPGHSDDADALADWRIVNSAYFASVNVPFVKGRNFVAQDTEKAPRVAIVDEYLAQKLWPNQDAVGRRFRLEGDDSPWMTVVGVVRHQTGGALEGSTHGQLYFPYPESAPAIDSSNFD